MYTNQELVEAQLNRKLTANESTMFSLVAAAVNNFIDDKVGISFDKTSEIERQFSIDGINVDIGAAYDISEVKIDGNVVTAYTAHPLNTSIKQWLHFNRNRCGTVTVKAKYGYPAVPDDITYAATYLAAQLYETSTVSNIKSESIEGYSVTFGDFIAENETVQMILLKYNKIPLIGSC